MEKNSQLFNDKDRILAARMVSKAMKDGAILQSLKEVYSKKEDAVSKSALLLVDQNYQFLTKELYGLLRNLKTHEFSAPEIEKTDLDGLLSLFCFVHNDIKKNEPQAKEICEHLLMLTHNLWFVCATLQGFIKGPRSENIDGLTPLVQSRPYFGPFEALSSEEKETVRELNKNVSDDGYLAILLSLETTDDLIKIYEDYGKEIKTERTFADIRSILAGKADKITSLLGSLAQASFLNLIEDFGGVGLKSELKADQLLNKCGHQIHESYLGRNPNTAENLKVDFLELSRDEKRKDFCLILSSCLVALLYLRTMK